MSVIPTDAMLSNAERVRDAPVNKSREMEATEGFLRNRDAS
jgi:hypothetical protein